MERTLHHRYGGGQRLLHQRFQLGSNYSPGGAGSGDYHEFTLGEAHVAGMLQIKPHWGEVPPNWGSYFCVEDIEASFQKAQDLGANVIVPVMDESDIRFCYLQDPQGVYLAWCR